MDKQSILSNPLLNLNLDERFILSCPTCQSSNLVFRNQPHRQKTSHTSKFGKEDFFTAFDHQERFINFLYCENVNCNEVVTVIGNIFYDEIYFDNNPESKKMIEVHKPLYFDPPINIFTIKKDFPKPLVLKLKASFSLFYVDNQACANSIRTVVEALLDKKNIPKIKLLKGKQKLLLLHDRIMLFEKKYSDESKYLLSIKHIGNAGSHNSKVESKDNLIAFTLLERVLITLFDTSEKKLKLISSKINKAKKPIKLRQIK